MTFLLDTNHATAHLNGDPRIAARLASGSSAGAAFVNTTTVLGELYYGAYASRHTAKNIEALTAFAAQVGLYPFDAPAADEFGKVKAEQRAKENPIPTADAQIAAVARVHGLTVRTNDAHFQSIDRLVTDDWLA